MYMNLDYYRVFYFVAKCKSLTLASKELFTSQPAITRTIKNLEHELGCRLFIRNKKGVDLTSEGQVLYEYVSSAINQIEHGENEVRKNTSASEGRITIGSTVTALDEFLFKFLNIFHSANPNTKINVFTQSTDITINRLKEGQIDIALITSPCTIYDDVEYVKLMSFDNVLIGGEQYKELAKNPLSLEEVSKYPFVAMSGHTQLRQYTNKLFLDNHLSVEPRIEADSVDVIIPFVKNNLGLSIVPLSLASHSLEKGTVVEIPLVEPLPKRYVYMVTSKVFPSTNIVKKFKKDVINYFKI